jgi:hypothetical protein
VQPDPKLDAYVDSLIANIAAARRRTATSIPTRAIDPEHPHPGPARSVGNWKRWTATSSTISATSTKPPPRTIRHRQAHPARHRLKSAKLLDDTFGPGKQSIWPGHQITEMGLAKLYRVTGIRATSTSRKFMLDVRGPRSGAAPDAPTTRSHSQGRRPDRGGRPRGARHLHVLGMADVAALTGDTAYVNAHRQDLGQRRGKKLYITGGIGATGAARPSARTTNCPT